MDNRVFWISLLVVALIVAAVLLQPKVEEQLAPELEDVWVAIEVAGAGVARVGPVELESGTEFTLHAVVSARDRQGELLYYTGAPALRFADREVAPELLRRWDRSKTVKVRWYTLEGRWPYLPLPADGTIQDFEFQDFLRSDWPIAWSVPGEIDAAHDDHFTQDGALPRQLFGTQRFQVRVELYASDEDLVPERVLRSWGVAELKGRIDEFPTVAVLAPGAAAPASRVFGLTQLEAAEGAPAELLTQIDELARNHIAFSLPTVLRDQVRGAGKRWQDLEWRPLDLTGAAAWGEPTRAGDLLRVGDRVVVLYEDRGQPGAVDYGDLCFDFVQGATVRPLSEVFSGEGQVVETASLAAS